MTAEDHLSPAQFFHGTSADLSPGDMISTGHPANYEGGPAEPPGSWTDSHVFMTTDAEGAQRHARNAAFVKGGMPHVYQVEPTGSYEPHPYDHPLRVYNYQSRSPLRVTGEHDLSSP